MDWIIEILEQVKDLKLEKIIFSQDGDIEFVAINDIYITKNKFICAQDAEQFNALQLKKMFGGFWNWIKKYDRYPERWTIDEDVVNNLKQLNNIFKEHNLKLDRSTRISWSLEVGYEDVVLKDHYYEQVEQFYFDDLDDEEAVNEFIKFVKGLQ